MALFYGGTRQLYQQVKITKTKSLFGTVTFIYTGPNKDFVFVPLGF